MSSQHRSAIKRYNGKLYGAGKNKTSHVAPELIIPERIVVGKSKRKTHKATVTFGQVNSWKRQMYAATHPDDERYKQRPIRQLVDMSTNEIAELEKRLGAKISAL